MQLAKQALIEPGNLMIEGLKEHGPKTVHSLLKRPSSWAAVVCLKMGFIRLLVSGEAPFLTGETVVIDGGQLLLGSPFLNL